MYHVSLVSLLVSDLIQGLRRRQSCSFGNLTGHVSFRVQASRSLALPNKLVSIWLSAAISLGKDRGPVAPTLLSVPLNIILFSVDATLNLPCVPPRLRLHWEARVEHL